MIIEDCNGYIHIIRAFQNRLDSNTPGFWNRIAIDARGDQRERYRTTSLLPGFFHSFLITTVQKLFFILIAALPDGAYSMGYISGFQLKTGRDDCLSRRTMPMEVTGCLQLCSASRSKNSATDTASVLKMRISSIYNAVYSHFSNILLLNRQIICHMIMLLVVILLILPRKGSFV